MTKLKAGITGGIGSGKSFCARIFSQLGVPVYDADSRAKELMQTNPLVREQLIALLGLEVYDARNKLSKEYLRHQVFENPDARAAINAIVHPAVAEDYATWEKNQNASYTLKEAALLVEAGSYRQLDYLIMVQAPPSIRMLRTIERDKIDSSEIIKRMESQLPESEKEAVSDFIIDNSGCHPLLEQIIKIHKMMIQCKN